jgi:hypothetical protein
MVEMKPARAGPFVLERVKGIEPSYAAWEATVLPLNYTRIATNCPSGAAGCQEAALGGEDADELIRLAQLLGEVEREVSE